MTIKEYWAEYFASYHKYPVFLRAQQCALGYTMPEYFSDTISRFTTEGYADAIDRYLQQLFGQYEIYVDEPEDVLDSFFFEREPYIRKQFEYLDAEYNPIENYSGHEQEENWIKSDEKVITDTHDHKQYRDTSFYDDHVIYYDEGQKKTTFSNGTRRETTLQGKEDTVNKVVPYNGSALQDASGSSRSGNAANDSIQTEVTTTYVGGDPYNIEENLALNGETTTDNSHTDYLEHGAHKDEDKRTADEYEDYTKRILDKTGNIGVQTAAQMMEMDRRLWESNKWLRYLAKDIAGLLGAEVMGL